MNEETKEPDEEDEKEENKGDDDPFCPDCRAPIQFGEGCRFCPFCGYSKCG